MLRRGRVLQKPVVESLMVALAVVVLDVLPREEAQVTLTEWDHTGTPSTTLSSSLFRSRLTSAQVVHRVNMTRV